MLLVFDPPLRPAQALPKLQKFTEIGGDAMPYFLVAGDTLGTFEIFNTQSL